MRLLKALGFSLDSLLAAKDTVRIGRLVRYWNNMVKSLRDEPVSRALDHFHECIDRGKIHRRLPLVVKAGQADAGASGERIEDGQFPDVTEVRRAQDVSRQVGRSAGTRSS